MHNVSARDALQYALSRELARLYAVIIAGWILLRVGVGASAAQDLTIRYLVGYPLLLLGTIALYGATIALLFKIVADANAAATLIVREP